MMHHMAMHTAQLTLVGGASAVLHGDRLARQIIESDRRYFEMGAHISRLPGADVAWLPGLAHCPSAVVVQRIAASRLVYGGSDWIGRVERRLRDLRTGLARLYLDAVDDAVADVLGCEGYEMRREIALCMDASRVSETDIVLREVRSRDDWRRKLQFHLEVPERPDGHGASARDWVALEHAKSKAGMRSFLAFRDGSVVGAIGALPSDGPWRLKNIVVHSRCRRQAVGRGMIARIAQMARDAGSARVCLFGVEGTAGEALYRACGFVDTGFQLEWTKTLA